MRDLYLFPKRSQATLWSDWFGRNDSLKSKVFEIHVDTGNPDYHSKVLRNIKESGLEHV